MDPARTDQVICVDNLPRLPLIADKQLRAIARPGQQGRGKQLFQMFEIKGDKKLSDRLVTVLQNQYGYISEEGHSMLDEAFTSNETFAALAFLYGLLVGGDAIAPGKTGSKLQKRQADAFEAYIGVLSFADEREGTRRTFDFLDALFTPAVFPHIEGLVRLWQAKSEGSPLRLGLCSPLPVGKRCYFQDMVCNKRVDNGRRKAAEITREAYLNVPLKDWRCHGVYHAHPAEVI